MSTRREEHPPQTPALAFLAAVLSVLSVLAVPALAMAQETPPRILPRANEDPRRWADTNEGVHRLKYIPLGESGYLSLGGDLRLRLTSVQRDGWRPGEDRLLNTQRLMGHAEVGGDRWRAFAQLKSGLAQGVGPISPVEQDYLDVHQAFLEVREVPLGPAEFALRVGRVEVSQGRLLTFREGPNIRLSHDGLWSQTTLEDTRLRLFALRPVSIAGGFFDDRSSFDEVLWGGALRQAFPIDAVDGWDAEAELHYFGSHDEGARYHRGEGVETRHTLSVAVGTGVDTEGLGADASFEVAGQFGAFDGLPIRAFRTSLEAGAQLSNLWSAPRLFVQHDLSSGDRADTTGLNTYQPHYPRGSQFSEFSYLAPANLMVLSPGVELSPRRWMTLRLDAGVFYRASADDGLYAMSGAPTLGPGGDDGADPVGLHVGNQAGLHLRLQPRQNLTLDLAAVAWTAGDFPSDLDRAATMFYSSAWLSARF